MVEMITFFTLKGQVDNPKELHEKLGTSEDSKLGISLAGVPIELQVLNEPTETVPPGFGMLKSKRPAIPADFDPAMLQDDSPS